MKILHVIPSYKPAYIYGGPVMSVSKLCENLAATEPVEVRLITTNANGGQTLDIPLNRDVDVDGVPVIYFPRVTGDPHEASPALWRYLWRNAGDYDIIHIHSWWNLCAVVAAAICTMKKTKVICSPRGMLSSYILESNNALQKKLLHQLVGKRILRKTYYHATSQQEGEECEEIIKGWKGFNIANLIELPDIPIRPVQNPVFTLGFLSRIDPKKGLEFILRAISRVPFPVKLVIAGKGQEEYQQSLQTLARTLGVEDKVEWAGWLGPERKFEALMGFDLFVLTSYNENFANVVIESLYMGTPVCISDKVGLADFIQASDMGWISTLDDADVEKQLTLAYADRGKRDRVRQEGRKVIEQHFSGRVLMERYMDMYKTVLSD